MKKYTLYMGLNDKDSKKQEINTLEAYKVTNKILLNYVDGATIFEADGIYKHENGTVVIEKTLKIELLFTDESTVKEIVNLLKITFNQESIAVQVDEISSDLW